MLTYINHILRNKKGQAMVELTIAVPTLAVFFSAILYFGRGLNAKISIRSAARHAVLADGRLERSGAISKSKMYQQFFLNKDRNKETLENRFTYTKGNESKAAIVALLTGYNAWAAAQVGTKRLLHIAGLAAMEVDSVGFGYPGAYTATCEYRVGRTSLFGKIMSGLSGKNYTTKMKLWADHDPGKVGTLAVVAAAYVWADPFHKNPIKGFYWDFSSFTLGKFGKDISWWKKCKWS